MTVIGRERQCSYAGTQGDKASVVTKFNRPTLLRNPPAEIVFGSDRVNKLPPEVARRAATTLLVG